MQCLFFIWRSGHHRSSEELQGFEKNVMGDSKFKKFKCSYGSHFNTLMITGSKKTVLEVDKIGNYVKRFLVMGKIH